jgi:hypothetical protein
MGYGGTSPIMSCTMCKKDICNDHRTFYKEDHLDYYAAVICPDCNPKFKKAWEFGMHSVEQYQPAIVIAMSRFKEL